MQGETKEQIAIALGANLGAKRETFEKALTYIDAEIGRVVARSSWIETSPLLHPTAPTHGQDTYLNGVILAETSLEAEATLSKLLEIEEKLGRNRDKEELPWSPRVIDLDLVFYGSKIIEQTHLVVPHSQMHLRAFVLGPLLEIAPDWIHPRLKKSTKELFEVLRE